MAPPAPKGHIIVKEGNRMKGDRIWVERISKWKTIPDEMVGGEIKTFVARSWEVAVPNQLAKGSTKTDTFGNVICNNDVEAVSPYQNWGDF